MIERNKINLLNKKHIILADHHMGCLIHGCVNGSIRQPNLDNLSVDQKAILSNIKVGSEVLFTVTKVDNHHDILFVLGDVAPQFYSRKRYFFSLWHLLFEFFSLKHLFV